MERIESFRSLLDFVMIYRCFKEINKYLWNVSELGRPKETPSGGLVDYYHIYVNWKFFSIFLPQIEFRSVYLARILK